jgi:hypothetical protein
MPRGREAVSAIKLRMMKTTVSSTHAVIASAAKQSRIPPPKDSGLLRCARNDGVDAVVCQTTRRAPDAAQRLLAVRCRAGAHAAARCVAFRVPALRSVTACRTASGTRERRSLSPHAVIASEAKQSRPPPREDSGLLRCVRNDDVDTVRAEAATSRPLSWGAGLLFSAARPAAEIAELLADFGQRTSRTA